VQSQRLQGSLSPPPRLITPSPSLAARTPSSLEPSRLLSCFHIVSTRSLLVALSSDKDSCSGWKLSNRLQSTASALVQLHRPAALSPSKARWSSFPSLPRRIAHLSPRTSSTSSSVMLHPSRTAVRAHLRSSKAPRLSSPRIPRQLGLATGSSGAHVGAGRAILHSAEERLPPQLRQGSPHEHASPRR
jgi:hypothetical protein